MVVIAALIVTLPISHYPSKVSQQFVIRRLSSERQAQLSWSFGSQHLELKSVSVRKIGRNNNLTCTGSVGLPLMKGDKIKMDKNRELRQPHANNTVSTIILLLPQVIIHTKTYSANILLLLLLPPILILQPLLLFPIILQPNQILSFNGCPVISIPTIYGNPSGSI